MARKKQDKDRKKTSPEHGRNNNNNDVNAPVEANSFDIFTDFLSAFLITLIVVVPLIFSTETKSNFIVPKMGIMGTATGVLAASFLIGIAIFKRIKITRSGLYIPMAAFIVAELVSMLNSSYMYASQVEFWARFTGVLAAVLLLNLVFSRVKLMMLVRGLAAVGLINAIVGIIQQSRLAEGTSLKGAFKSLFEVKTPVMILGNTNYSAGYMLFTIFLAMGLAFYEKEKALKGLWIASALIMCISGIFTDCQGAYLGALTGVIAFGAGTVLSSESFRLNGAIVVKAISVLTITAIIILAAAFMLSRSTNKPLKTYLKPGPKAYMGRLIMWHSTWFMSKEHLIIGNGVGSYQSHYLPALSKYLETTDPLKFLNQIQNAEKAHNQYLQMIAEEGFFGLFAFLGIIICGHVIAFRDIRRIESPNDRGLLLGITSGLIAFEALLFVSSLMVISPLREYFFVMTALQFLVGRVALSEKFSWEIEINKKLPAALGIPLRGGLVFAGVGIVVCSWIFSANVLRANVRLSDGNRLTEMRRYREALMAYDKAEKISPGNAKVKFYKGSVFLLINRQEEGYNLLKEASTKYPDVNLYTNLGKVSTDLGRRDEAREWYKKAADTYLRMDFTHGAFAANLATSGKFEEALKIIENILKMYPNDTKVLAIKALALMNTGREAEALELYEHIIQTNPKDAESINNTGVLLMKTGNFKEAEMLFRKVLLLRPGHINSLNNLASAQFRQGKKELARKNWLKIIEIDPTNATALKNLRDLYPPPPPIPPEMPQ